VIGASAISTVPAAVAAGPVPADRRSKTVDGASGRALVDGPICAVDGGTSHVDGPRADVRSKRTLGDGARGAFDGDRSLFDGRRRVGGGS